MDEIEEPTPPSLIDRCIDILIAAPDSRNVERLLVMYERIDLQPAAMSRLRDYVMKMLHDYFPLLIDKYTEAELQQLLDPEHWKVLHDTHTAIQRDKQLFAAMKGTVLDRKVVEYDKDSEYYPLAALQHGVVWPSHVPASRREAFLSPEDFHETFGMTKQAFNELPSYVRVRMKKEKMLF